MRRAPRLSLLAAMNMASAAPTYFGKELANTASRGSAIAKREASLQVVREAEDNFTSDQHPDLRADFVMANPPFNISEWWDAKLESDPHEAGVMTRSQQ